ncbi:MAG: DUF2834 domain-containing protein [Limnoraphis robusta]|uniref:DUF2834 domain-containing protein n=1 Tax=Limnoraphis robusta CS-951 TaxID=1637645 RepID=A0A0F5YED6_9CYAN|nr:hypothetical protein [Limnoraphis robusta]KKD37103.1 hypothetical protein WN50_16175 [Limnoraphis robusta CS-951]
MFRKVFFGLLWIGFVAYAFTLAPPDQPDTLTLIKNLSTGNWQGINPLIVALFNLMGIWPIIYSSLLVFEGQDQNLRAWPFAIASFGVGAFAILPYLALRQPSPEYSGDQNFFLKIFDSRITGVILTLGTLTLIGYGLNGGDGSDFIQQWQTSRFIHVMSLDFCLLCLLFPALLGDDMTRRGMNNQLLFWGVALLPLLGPLFYLCVRSPKTPTPPQTQVNQQQSQA